jgi:hypothetical protein
VFGRRSDGWVTPSTIADLSQDSTERSARFGGGTADVPDAAPLYDEFALVGSCGSSFSSTALSSACIQVPSAIS